jgi:glycerol kinase
MDLVRRQWDDELLALFETPKACLPKLTSSVNNFGTILVNKKNIPLLVVIGDQQAALIGQGGFTTNGVAMNFGTSGSIQINVGKKSTHVNGLISSVLYSDQKEHFYILEGTINACNSLFYQLEKELKIPHKQMLWDDRCTMTKTEGVYVPTFSGLASPYWVDEYNLVSKGYGNNLPNEIIRAGMESIGLLVNDILSLAKSKLKDLPNNIMASGGGARPSLLQFISDLTGITVHRSPMKDRTALGVHALLNKTHNGTWPMINISHKDGYLPKMIQSERKIKIERWNSALIEAGVK